MRTLRSSFHDDAKAPSLSLSSFAPFANLQTLVEPPGLVARQTVGAARALSQKNPRVAITRQKTVEQVDRDLEDQPAKVASTENRTPQNIHDDILQQLSSGLNPI